MRTIHPFRRGLAALGLLLTAGAALAENPPAPASAPARTGVAAEAAPAARERPTPPVPSFSRSERYTAQRKPRITVYDFADANKDADDHLYGDSVEAMLETYLKRKSQFVVVERQRLGAIMDDWNLARDGQVNLSSQDPSALKLLEKIDAVLVGSVTLLDAPSTAQRVVERRTAGTGGNVRRIELDVKALGRSDGRIIAAAQRSGPVFCLRSIVARLGAALEQAFLRPYYGQIQFRLASPENVRLWLTPILSDEALDEEKPPVELGESVLLGRESDAVQPWTTNPNAYTVQNLLSGWYTARLERPGYEGMGIDGNEDWMARELGGKVQILYQVSDEPGRPPVPLTKVPEELRRFVVYVHPREVRVLNGNLLDFSLTKQGGSLAPLVRRQHLDQDFTHTPRRVILIGGDGIDLNRADELREFDDDPTCELFDEELPPRNDFGLTYVASGESFDFGSFQGGELIFEDYRGETIPAGEYQIAYWEPSYKLQEGKAIVNHGDRARATQAALTRESLPLDLETTGPRLPHHMVLMGKDTGYKVELPLSFSEQSHPGLPVDHYVASSDIPGLRAWRNGIALLSRDLAPPVYDPTLAEERRRLQQKAARPEAGQPDSERKPDGGKTKEGEEPWLGSERRADGEAAEAEKRTRGKEDEGRVAATMPLRFPAPDDAEKVSPARLRIKTRLCVAGQLAALGSLAQLESEDVCFDPEIATLLEKSFEPVTQARKQRRKFYILRRRESDQPPRPEPVETKNRTRWRAGPVEAAEEDEREARERELARVLLAERLAMVDLLILDDDDMKRLRDDPETAAVVARYVAEGGALYAFVAERGDYSQVLGAPFSVKHAGRRTRRFRLVPGEVSGVELQLTGKKRVRVARRRKLLRLEEASEVPWRVVAFTTAGKGPRIVERGSRERGGYVVVWLDRPAIFRTRFLGRRVEGIEENRAKAAQHVLGWTRNLLVRRYDDPGQDQRQAAVEPVKPDERLKQLSELLHQGLITRDEYEKKREEVLHSL